MKYQELYQHIRRLESFLCVGLDTDPERIPSHLQTEDDPVFAFNRAIIEATAEYCVAYKINTAFYEAQGAKGWESMARTLEYIPKDKFTIADAKRGDIGNTVHQYARAFFKQMDFDSITVAPYMGEDSVQPFLEYPDKWVILLALTSNPSGQDFQLLDCQGENLYEKVLKTSRQWGGAEQMMYVVGATKAQSLESIRKLVPEHFLLVPGVGAQGGSLAEVAHWGMNDQVGLLVNVSRGIIYASSGEDFARKAGEKAREYQQEMANTLKNYFKRVN